MSIDQDEGEGAVAEPLLPTSLPAKERIMWPARIGVGAAISFALLSILYGPNQVITIGGLLVICTAGLGLIPLLFVSWAVGWIVIAAWEAIVAGRGPATVS